MEGIELFNITDAVQSSLNLLASKLRGVFPQSELDSVKRVIDLAGAKDHADFYHRVTVNYTSPTASRPRGISEMGSTALVLGEYCERQILVRRGCFA